MAEYGDEIDDHVGARAVNHSVPVNVPAAIAAWQRHQLPFHNHRDWLHLFLPARGQVAVAVEPLPQTGWQFAVIRRVIRRDDLRVARLEIAAPRSMVAMIETTIILILMLRVLLPMLLIFVPVLRE